ncbi:molecular chaperone Skp [Candidatus Fukatsuia symbiotica]|uniref:Chaperone protein Skp n=1 Tax=Candidatus Fukatsuia symbiotica TaxID=1878942 RepID=A0A2U8I7A0_9GAMM|nr:molecular chaperone Skp [Candidatus Fukatsuia symbiotica]AWK15042.1 molecular chaperone [Candidatus Fukatsuia symbiotica]MEA9443845.1 molecular chaperone Skp [Candidatus Fukatsuia symbiotica]
MKKWLYATGLGLALMTSAGVQAGDKIAIVNVAQIFQKLPAREAVAKQLENEFKGRATDLKSMEEKLRTDMEKLQRDRSIMKTSDISSMEKNIMEQRETFGNKAQTFEIDNRRRQTEERNKILSRIQDAVKTVATKKSYDMVIDVSAVVYALPSKDITADVLKEVK